MRFRTCLRKEREMKGKKVLMILFSIVVACAFVLAHGCAKKAVMKEEATTGEAAPEKQAAAQAEPAKPAPQPQVSEAEAAAAATAAKEASEFLDIHFAFDRYDLRPDERDPRPPCQMAQGSSRICRAHRGELR
jgi:outer membrane protein OmpA-like peptidoglycan-associated protein